MSDPAQNGITQNHVNGALDERIDCLVDELLSPLTPIDRAAAARRELVALPRGSDHLAQHQRVDERLRVLFAPPAKPAVPALSQLAQIPLRTPKRLHPLRIAAMLLFASAAAIAGWALLSHWSQSMRERGPSWDQLYMAEINSGFDPDLKYTTQAELTELFVIRLGREVTLSQRDSSDGVELVGISLTPPAISIQTLTLLTRVDEKPVMMMADALSRDVEPPFDAGSGLYLHRREAPPLVYYEVSPWPEPRVIPLLSEPTERICPPCDEEEAPTAQK